MKKTLKGVAVASAVAALFATAQAAGSKAPVKEKASKTVHCQGINGCKGQAACATADNGCAGENACKGKGWIKVSEKECHAKGGTILPEE